MKEKGFTLKENIFLLKRFTNLLPEKGSTLKWSKLFPLKVDLFAKGITYSDGDTAIERIHCQ